MADTNVNNVGSNVGNTKTSIASEYTLNELLLAFKASSGVSDKQLKALKGLSDHYKPGKDGNEKASKGFGKLSDAADALEGSLRNIPKHFENFDDFLTKGAQKPVNALGGQIQKLSHGFGTFADAMPKWTKFFGTGIIATAFGTLGTTAGILTGYLQNSLDAFKDLSSVGGNFGNSIIDMRKAALRGNLSLDEFSDLVKQNSELFATIGTNVSQGATTFADLSNKVRKFGDQRLKTYNLNFIEKGNFIYTVLVEDMHLAELITFIKLREYRLNDEKEIFICHKDIIKKTFDEIGKLFEDTITLDIILNYLGLLEYKENVYGNIYNQVKKIYIKNIRKILNNQINSIIEINGNKSYEESMLSYYKAKKISQNLDKYTNFEYNNDIFMKKLSKIADVLKKSSVNIWITRRRKPATRLMTCLKIVSKYY